MVSAIDSRSRDRQVRQEMVTGVETSDRVEIEDAGASDTVVERERSLAWWVHRLAPASLTSRIVLLNIAGPVSYTHLTLPTISSV